MSKIKIKKIVIALTVLAGSLVFARAGAVFAASEPGCYVQVTSRAGLQVPKVTCPSEGLTRETSAPSNKCFLAISNSSNPPASDFKEKPCSDITSTTAGVGTGADLGQVETGDPEGLHTCGKGDGNEVKVSFDFGCLGEDYGGDRLNPIVDMAFAIFRFFAAGVGLVVIGSVIVSGILYTSSRGDPQVTTVAIKRMTNSLIALAIYLLMFAIINFLVPGGILIH